MGEIKVEKSMVIDAAPEKIYAVISDYQHGHPAILPKAYFQDLVVEQGGKGDGTVVRTRMKVYGVEKSYRLFVSEPEPGRVLAENDPEAGVYTTFTIAPIGDGKRSQVTITTISKTSPGFAGVMEKLINPSITRKIYTEELNQLARYVRE